MPRFAANLSWMYTELPLPERFAAAARDGFTAVELLFPYAFAPQELRQRLQDHGLQLVLFNGPPGELHHARSGTDTIPPARGCAAIPGAQEQLRAGVALALEYAEHLQCPRIHLMAGVPGPQHSSDAAWQTYQSNLHWAVEQAAKVDVQILIEPINTRDVPGYLLNRQDQAHALVQQIGAENLKVQMDLYHCQIVEGDVEMKLRQYLPTGQVGHMQLAGVPARNEPDTGELAYPYLFSVIDGLGYGGWIGCEYRPADGTPGGTSRGLGWLRPWLMPR